MSLDKPTPDAIDGAELRFAIVSAGYNTELVQALKQNAIKGLRAAGVPAGSIVELAVPGSGEIPFAASSAPIVERGRRRVANLSDTMSVETRDESRLRPE
jgi:6,7-dimethyl-8-ribityllumazine synthase